MQALFNTVQYVTINSSSGTGGFFRVAKPAKKVKRRRTDPRRSQEQSYCMHEKTRMS
jgi:hypothetical protein